MPGEEVLSRGAEAPHYPGKALVIPAVCEAIGLVTMSQGLIDQFLLIRAPPTPEPINEIHRLASSPLKEERHSSIVTRPNLGCRSAEMIKTAIGQVVIKHFLHV